MDINVLHVTPAYYPATYWGGPIFSVYGLNNALAQLDDVNLKVLTTDSSGPNTKDRLSVINNSEITYSPGYKVIFSKKLFGSEVSLKLIFDLRRYILWADVVHLTATYSFTTIPTILFCRYYKKPLVWSPRGGLLATEEWSEVRKPIVKSVWEKFCNFLLVNKFTFLHVTSLPEALASEKRIPKGRARIIPNGVEIPDLPMSRAWKPNNILRIMFIGRIDKKKGIEVLLGAVALLSDINFELRIYGDGNHSYLDKLKKLSSELGLISKVIFCGHVVGKNKLDAFMNADLVVVPSFSENFCMVVAESLAHGVPVIASKGTPWADLPSRKCGDWVDVSPIDLACSIKKLSKMNLRDMGENGRLWMMQSFSWSGVAKEVRELYFEALEVSTDIL